MVKLTDERVKLVPNEFLQAGHSSGEVLIMLGKYPLNEERVQSVRNKEVGMLMS